MTLEAWLKQDHSLPDQLKVIEGLCSALNDAHQNGDVHRGLTPANIDVAGDGTCDLADAVEGSASPRYRAPEVADGGPPSAEADIYSAGVIFYEMLSGRSPSGERPAALADLRPDVSRDLTDAIMGCLERGPDWRPKDLSYLLQVVGSMRNVGTRGARTAPRAIESSRTAAKTGSRKAPRGSTSQSNLPLIGLTVLLAVGAGAGLWWYFTQSRDSGVARLPPPPRPTVPTTESTPPPTLVATAPSPTGPVTPAPRPTPSPLRPETTLAATPPPTLAPATRPTPTPEPVRVATPPPTAPPTVAVATPPPVAAATLPAAPAVLTAVSPLAVKRGITTMLDVRGSNLRSDLQARIVRVKEAVNGVSVVRQKWVDPTLIKVLVNIDPSANPGLYGVALVDGSGTQTNGLNFTVSK